MMPRCSSGGAVTSCITITTRRIIRKSNRILVRMILVVSVERISLPRTCQPRHGSLWITRSPSYHQACSIFVPIIQYSNWFVDVCRCFFLIATLSLIIVQRRPPRAQLDARIIVHKPVSPISKCLMTHLSDLIWVWGRYRGATCGIPPWHI